jgi:hypothetical protein
MRRNGAVQISIFGDVLGRGPQPGTDNDKLARQRFVGSGEPGACGYTSKMWNYRPGPCSTSVFSKVLVVH